MLSPGLRSAAIAMGDAAGHQMIVALASPPDSLSGMILEAWRFEVIGGAFHALKSWEASIVEAGVEPDDACLARFHASLVVMARVELTSAASAASGTAN